MSFEATPQSLSLTAKNKIQRTLLAGPRRPGGPEAAKGQGKPRPSEHRHVDEAEGSLRGQSRRRLSDGKVGERSPAPGHPGEGTRGWSLRRRSSRRRGRLEARPQDAKQQDQWRGWQRPQGISYVKLWFEPYYSLPAGWRHEFGDVACSRIRPTPVFESLCSLLNFAAKRNDRTIGDHQRGTKNRGIQRVPLPNHLTNLVLSPLVGYSWVYHALGQDCRGSPSWDK